MTKWRKRPVGAGAKAFNSIYSLRQTACPKAESAWRSLHLLIGATQPRWTRPFCFWPAPRVQHLFAFAVALGALSAPGHAVPSTSAALCAPLRSLGAPGLASAGLSPPMPVATERAVHTAASEPAVYARQVDELLRHADAHQQLGYYRRSIEELRAGLALAEETDDRYRIAALSSSLGSALLAIGETSAARRELQRSLDIARGAGSTGLEAVVRNNFGNLFAAEGDATAALGAYDDSARLALAARQPELAARAAINAARLLAGLPQPDGEAAEARLRLALTALDRAPASPAHAFELVSIGILLRELDAAAGSADRRRLDAARTALSRAVEIAAEFGDVRTESYALGHLGRLYENRGQIDQALRLTREAMFLAQTADAPKALYLWRWQAGRLLAAQGNLDAAITAYEGALRTLQSIRTDLSSVDRRTGAPSFREATEPVFLGLADLLLRRAAAGGDRAERADLAQARATIELLKAAELESYFQDECVAVLQSRITSIDRLADRTAVLYPIVLPDRTELLLGISGELKRVTVAVPRAELNAEVRDLRRALEDVESAQGFLPHARRIYSWLIAPIEGALAKAGIDTLVFVPDGALRTIPLSALHDGDRFVVARYAVATVPGLTLLDARPIARGEIRPLIAGLSEPVQGFPALENVETELHAIQQMYGGTVLKNEAFVTARLAAALAETPYTVVHLATHATFARNPEDSYLLTHNGQLGLDDLERLVAPSRFRAAPVELITLSACQTAAGDDRAALGLAGVAIKAGARSALATLWTVYDPATAVLVPEFYRQLGDPRLSKAQALRRAQLSVLRDERLVHPAYWSPFLIIGNWL
jgi:CHAT domain-containing protein